MKAKKRLLLLIPALVAVIAVVLYFTHAKTPLNEQQQKFMDKADHLKAQVVTQETTEALGAFPVESLGHVVFLSLSDGTARAKVYHGDGKTLSKAWDNAARSAAKDIGEDSKDIIWLRADVVNKSWPTLEASVQNALDFAVSGFSFHGLALDDKFKTAFIEGELNGRGIYDYKSIKINIDPLNACLQEKGQQPIDALPKNMVGFTTWGWFCDENNVIYPLYREGADTGRREVGNLDADTAKNLIDAASNFIVNQVKDNGMFIYGLWPITDEENENYNILRHSGTIWSLVCRYRMFPDEKVREMVEKTIDYMISQIKTDENGAGYLYEEKDMEFKLGGNGIAVVALTEYMDVFQTDKYTDTCILLGEGILAQQGDDGGYWHVLNHDFSKMEEFRTVYYDGECTFALTRLYSLTKDQKWLDAACKAIDHFIEYDYTQYRDHWVAYSLNEVTKYVDKQEYWNFALANATNNYERILGRVRTYPTNLELLMSAFETWQRMVEKGIDTGDFEVKQLLDAISARANRQLSGYYYPELAMYMKNPQRILNTFMVRNDKFRVRIDDVQHNIGGYYLYWKNYDAMVEAGLNPSIMDLSIEA